MKLLSIFLISIGALLMALNIIKFREVRILLKQIAKKEYDSLKSIFLLHQFLISSFFVGYIIVLLTIISTEFMIGNLFVSIIFISGSAFVLLGISLQKRMIFSIEATYEKILISNKNLSLNQKELSQANQTLKTEITKHRQTSENLKRSFETQKVVNEILKQSLKESKIESIVDNCLDLILSLPWLAFEAQGSVFLVKEDPNSLVLISSRGFSEELKEKCNNVPFGKCLCGLAAERQEIVFADQIDERHGISTPGMKDHGHYCVPILIKESTAGIINIYVKPGHKRNFWEEEFLKTVANTLAIILMRFDSEKKNKEMTVRLSQSQKMESIGTLAGGIAHDFNNILSGILGYSQLAKRNLDDSEKIEQNLSQIINGTKRASDLIQQILTFSRQTGSKKMPVKLHSVIGDVIKFLRSSMPSTIKINQNLFSEGYVKADIVQLQQIVMNLCTNAFHAMKNEGGVLTISLTEVDLDEESLSTVSGAYPGTYLKMEIKDTGHGIPQDIIDKIYEPYYTTKKVEEGTGLGLSVVHGIVLAHNGFITVDSRPEEGTIFSVLLPKFEEQVKVKTSTDNEIRIVGGSESILLLDDEETILNSTTELLKDYGYSVKSFSNVKAALKAYETNPEKFDLIITDMTMPDMTGEQFALKLFDIRKDASIILCTGYSEKISKNKALKMGVKKFFQKPVDNKRLLQSIRKILDDIS